LGFYFAAGASDIVGALILATLANNWLTALVYFATGAGLSTKTERIILGVSFGLVGVIAAMALGFAISVAIFYKDYRWTLFITSNEVPALASAKYYSDCYAAVSVALKSLATLFAIFLFVSSIIGLIVLKRKKRREEVRAVARLLFVACILLVCVSVQLACMTLNYGWVIPQWFQFGLVRVGVNGLMTVTYLVFVFLAFYNTHLQVRGHSQTSISTELLALSDENSEERTSVPKAYEI
jgi:uncharacterized membrane protein